MVVAFLGTECPLAKLYAPRLVELAAEFKDRGVAFVGIDSNQQDSVTELAHYAKEHKVEFPLLKDAGNTIADQFGAVRTPEVFLLDSDRMVRYWGRIDDQYGFQESGVGLSARRADAPRSGRGPGRSAGRQARQPGQRGQHRAAASAASKQPVANSEVTYTKHIATIFNANCVYCHRAGQIAPVLADYRTKKRSAGPR